jgi:hypothetical protein
VHDPTGIIATRQADQIKHGYRFRARAGSGNTLSNGTPSAAASLKGSRRLRKKDATRAPPQKSTALSPALWRQERHADCPRPENRKPGPSMLATRILTVTKSNGKEGWCLWRRQRRKTFSSPAILRLRFWTSLGPAAISPPVSECPGVRVRIS